MSQPPLSFLAFQTVSAPEKQSCRFVNTDEALGFLQCHLQKVAKYQHISEVSTNNILVSLIS